jgi:hypothetical protein
MSVGVGAVSAVTASELLFRNSGGSAAEVCDIPCDCISFFPLPDVINERYASSGR